jgi:hypothetical protein
MIGDACCRVMRRYADPKVIEKADLVTEMCESKHYYCSGVQVRESMERQIDLGSDIK